MESSNFVMALVSTFIGVAILLAIGIQVLGNVQNSTQCATLPGGPGTGPLGKWVATASNSTGWALSCVNANTSIQSGYSLLLVIVVVIAAVAILSVVRLL